MKKRDPGADQWLPLVALIWIVVPVLITACGGEATSRPVVSSRPVTEQPVSVTAEAPPQAAPTSAPEATPSEAGAPSCANLLDAAYALLRQAGSQVGSAKADTSLRAGEGLVLAWRNCRLAGAAPADIERAGASELLENLAQAFETAGRADRASLAYLIALDGRWPVLSKRVHAGARDQLLRLAQKLEADVAAAPENAGAPEALAAAVYARLAVGDPQQASRDVAAYRRRFGQTYADQAAEPGAVVAAYFNEREAWAKALAELPAAAEPKPPASVRSRLIWHAERGQALAGLGRQREAVPEFDQVQSLWEGLSASERQALTAPFWPSPMPVPTLVLDAVGAAYFSQAELVAERARQSKFPAYRGSKADDAAVNRFIRTDVTEWNRRIVARLEEASAAYKKIVDIQPAAPPRWMVAAGCRVGELWSRYVDDVVKKTPVPLSIAKDPELMRAYRKALAEAALPRAQMARNAFKVCLAYSEKSGINNRYSEACRKWLKEHPDPDQVP